jgi:hypothetical protein
MDRQAVKDLMFGGISELVRNSKYYYHSSVGEKYCHWTTEGELALQDFMNVMAHKLKEADEADLRTRAKEMTINALKGETV